MKFIIPLFLMLLLQYSTTTYAQDVEVEQIDAANYSFSLRKQTTLHSFRPHVPFIVIESKQLPVLIKALDAKGMHDTSFTAEVKLTVGDTTVKANFKHGYASIFVPVKDMRSVIINSEYGTAKLIRPVYISKLPFYVLLALLGVLVLVFYIKKITAS
jgi:hypothetical protein